MDMQDVREQHRVAQSAAETALEAVVQYLQSTPAPTAEAAHQLIDETLAGLGYDSPEGHIVAGGTQAFEPHEKGSGVLPRNELIVIDIYPRSRETGRWGDITRTVSIGEPTDEARALFETVLAAQQHALSLVKAGVKANDIQNASWEFFAQAGYQTSGIGREFTYKEGFVHSIGHGVGKEIHQPPFFGDKSDDVLQVGDVITIEPGLYYEAIGGVRIEDMIMVTEDGFENLTSFPKTLIIE